MRATEVETTISRPMRRSRFGAFVLGTLLLTLPASGTLTFCLDGTAPDCCDSDRTAPPSPDAGTTVGTGLCDCCIAVDALPFDRGSSQDRVVATPIAVASGIVAPHPITWIARPNASHGIAAAPSRLGTVLRV